MARSNLSQNHWAMKLGLSRGHWSDIVNGFVNLSEIHGETRDP
jgi:hypothetical protein